MRLINLKMETIKQIKKEIEELSEQFKDMLTVDEPQDLDEYPEEEWKEVYGDDLFFSDTMQSLMKKKFQVKILKEINRLINVFAKKYNDGEIQYVDELLIKFSQKIQGK